MIKKIFYALRQAKSDIANQIIFSHYGVKVEKPVGHIEGVITVRTSKKGSIRIGENAELRSGKSYNIVGGDTRMVMRTIGDGHIAIGKHVGIANSALVSASSICIEDNVMIGNGCKIWDTDFHSLDYDERVQVIDTNYATNPIFIKCGAFIGGNCIVLKGVTIGEKSIVGAGSVVTKSIPDGEIWGGAPARFIRKI